MKEAYEVIIVGGGTGGLVLADSLCQKGRRIAILERQPHFVPPARGEIIQPNGLKILDQLGLLDEVKRGGSHLNQIFHFLTTDGQRLCTIDYRILPLPYNYCLITVPVTLLTPFYKRLSEYKEVNIYWGTEFQTFLKEGSRIVGVKAWDHVDRCERLLQAPVVVGADGVYSHVREEMGIRYRLKAYRHGYLTLFIKRPKDFGPEGRYFVGKRKILGVFPVSDTSLYLFYLVSGDHRSGRGLPPSEREDPAALDALKREIISFDPGLEEGLESVTDWDQVGFMPCRRVRAERWVGEGVALIGDAAHAMNPHASQGRNQAMEDAVVLSEVILECLRRGDFSQRALSVYELTRRETVERLQRLADEQVFFWNAGDPVRTWLRDRVFRIMDRNKRLRYGMLSQVAGLRIQPYSLSDYLKAAGFLPDPKADEMS